MELSYDWRGFQSLFYPDRKESALAPTEPQSPVYFVEEMDTIISAFSDKEDLGEWVGSSVDEVKKHFQHRELAIFQREKVDQWLSESRSCSHYLEQMDFLKSKALPEVVQSRRFLGAVSASKGDVFRSLVQRHFLLEAICGWWGSVLPSSYGLFLRVEGSEPRDFVLIIRRGVIENYYCPDLSGIVKGRAEDLEEAAKILSERHTLPIQAIATSVHEWRQWATLPDPWKEIALSIRTNRTKLAPFRWGLVTLIATRGFVGV